MVTVRTVLRADWIQSSDSLWRGTFRVSEGQVESANALQMRSGQVGVLPAVDVNEVHFQSVGVGAWAGLEFVIQAPPHAQVQITLDGHELAAPLEELLHGTALHANSPSRMHLYRAASDILPVRAGRTPLIFAPGETVVFEVEMRLLACESRTVQSRFQVALRSASDGTWLFTREADLPVPVNAAAPPRRDVTVRMPAAEGVYDLVIRLEPAGQQALERVVQFVVLNPGTAPASGPSEFEPKLVQEIDPAQATSAGPWYSTRRLKARTTRLGQFLWTSVRHPFSASELAKEPPVLAFRLNVENPGRAHVISIDYEDCGNLLLASAITENDPQGVWTQLPLASGIRTLDKPAGSSVQSHQLICWPRTTRPTITLSVDGATGLSALKKIRLQEMPLGLPVLDVPEAEGARRLFGLYLDNPDVWASWSSGRALGGPGHPGVDDWQTFLDSMTHLCEYARFAGHNSILSTVVGHGGALFPTKTLDANFRLDNGMASQAAPDPVRKDVVELFLRICQRHRLSFIPAVRFDGAIAAIDQKLPDADSCSTGLVLVSRDGSVWDGPTSSGTQPARRYNPLNVQVQAAMLEVIRELAGRYAVHANFEGMALDLAPSTHAVLPGLDWGYDDDTMHRFQQDSGVELPDDSKDDPQRFARRHQLLTTTAREQWIAWRCRQLRAFYEAALVELQRVKPRAPLFMHLTTLTGLGGDEPREPTRTGRTIEELLRSKGIDLRKWSTPHGVVVLRPFVVTGTNPEGLQLNASREIDELMAHLPSRGSLCIQGPELCSLSPANSIGDRPVEGAGDPIAVPVTPPGRSNIRRYAQSLAASDCLAIFEGGPTLPLGHEQVQREFARVFRSLPTSEFRSLETLQPVVVRSCRESRDTLVYLVNDASYSVETNLAFNCTAQSVLTNGSTGDRLTTHAVEQGLGARLALEPFQTLFLRLTGPDVRVAQCDVFVPQAAERGLKVRFDRLMQAMAIMGSDSSRTLDGLPPNGDFEKLDDQDVPARWSAEGDCTQLASDSQILHGGSYALRLEGKCGSTAVSEFFAPPVGRALAMNVWLRGGAPGTRIRWFLSGEHNGDTVYRCYADVAIGTNWEPKQFRARDLPDGQIDRIQVKFQLLDEGTAWVDEARVCALPISQDEKLAISKSVSAISKAWRERRWSDFERLSDGYWPTYLVDSVEAARKDF